MKLHVVAREKLPPKILGFSLNATKPKDLPIQFLSFRFLFL